MGIWKDWREKKENGPEVIFEKIMTENFEKNNKRNQAPDLRPKNHKEYNTKKKKKSDLGTAKKN